MLFDQQYIGANLSINELGTSARLDALLFGESQARAVIAVHGQDEDSILEAADQVGLSAISLGETDESDHLKLQVAGELVLDTKVSGLKNVWESAIPNQMEIA